MENPILYVVLNKELKMSAGKAAAQAVHAAMMLKSSSADSFTKFSKRTVIVLEAENEAQIRNLQEYLLTAEIDSAYYIDEGVNEVGAYSLTALAVEPFLMSEEQKREIFAPFSLFSGFPVNSRAVAERWLRAESHYAFSPRYLRKALKYVRNQK